YAGTTQASEKCNGSPRWSAVAPKSTGGLPLWCCLGPPKSSRQLTGQATAPATAVPAVLRGRRSRRSRGLRKTLVHCQRDDRVGNRGRVKIQRSPAIGATWAREQRRARYGEVRSREPRRRHPTAQRQRRAETRAAASSSSSSSSNHRLRHWIRCWRRPLEVPPS
ncbi:unnamed protein product, partial [Scytosiphon promiscuus]